VLNVLSGVLSWAGFSGVETVRPTGPRYLVTPHSHNILQDTQIRASISSGKRKRKEARVRVPDPHLYGTGTLEPTSLWDGTPTFLTPALSPTKVIFAVLEQRLCRLYAWL